jgi:hypothetical protein
METAHRHMPIYMNTMSYDFVCEEKFIRCSRNTQATAVHGL